MASIECLHVLHHTADYIFISFGIIEPILVTFKTEYRLCRCGGGGGGGGGGGVGMGVCALQTALLHVKRLNKTRVSNFRFLIDFFPVATFKILIV